MHLSLSPPLASRFELLDQCGSTNSELVARAGSDGAADVWPDFSVVVSADQTAGRGRLDRVWVAPPGQSLAVSVLLRPRFALSAYGWLPLIAGLAMARAVDSVLPEAHPASEASLAPEASPAPTFVEGPVAIKWPNDVQVGGLKVSGLLSELLPGASGVVVGAGLNLSIPADSLPTGQSTSLLLCGAADEGLFDRALASYLTALRELYRLFAEHDGDAEVSGIRRMVEERCGTLGQQVRVDLPNGAHHFGRAIGLDSDGQLRYRADQDATVQTVAAGDVTHLRYE